MANIFYYLYTVSLWDHLLANNRKILSYFVRVCLILSSQILELDLMHEAHSKLIEIVKLIKRNYGRGKITPNLHLSIHLFDCSFDYGLLYSFWYFTFERMNGILGKLLSDFLINF